MNLLLINGCGTRENNIVVIFFLIGACEFTTYYNCYFKK